MFTPGNAWSVLLGIAGTLTFTEFQRREGDILAISLTLTKTVITQKAIQLKEAMHLHGLSQKKKMEKKNESRLIKWFNPGLEATAVGGWGGEKVALSQHQRDTIHTQKQLKDVLYLLCLENGGVSLLPPTSCCIFTMLVDEYHHDNSPEGSFLSQNNSHDEYEICLLLQ